MSVTSSAALGRSIEYVSDALRHFYRRQPPMDNGESMERRVRSELRPRTGHVTVGPKGASAVRPASPATTTRS